MADVNSHEALKAYEARIHEAFPGFDVVFEDLLVEGDRVAMRLTITGDHQRPMMDIEPTGTEVTFGNTILHRMEGGLIAERRGQPDVFGILVRLGAIDRPSYPPVFEGVWYCLLDSRFVSVTTIPTENRSAGALTRDSQRSCRHRSRVINHNDQNVIVQEIQRTRRVP